MPFIKKKDKTSYKSLNKIQEQLNIRDFFDKFIRIEQKARIKGEFPTIDNLTRLSNYRDLYDDIFGTLSITDQRIRVVKKIAQNTIAHKLEYSISIDGGGRREFIKSHLGIKETLPEDEEERDLLDKASDVIL